MKIKIPTFKERQRLIQNDRAAKALAVNGGPGSGPQGGKDGVKSQKSLYVSTRDTADRLTKAAEESGKASDHLRAAMAHSLAAAVAPSQGEKEHHEDSADYHSRHS
jgi:hypothetical protein